MTTFAFYYLWLISKDAIEFHHRHTSKGWIRIKHISYVHILAAKTRSSERTIWISSMRLGTDGNIFASLRENDPATKKTWIFQAVFDGPIIEFSSGSHLPNLRERSCSRDYQASVTYNTISMSSKEKPNQKSTWKLLFGKYETIQHS